jgi:hypothetical protein
MLGISWGNMLTLIETSGVPGTRVELVPKEAVPPLWAPMLEIMDTKGKELLTVFSEEELFTLLCHGVIDLWLGVRGTGLLDGFALCAWEVHARARNYHIIGIMGDNLKLYLEEGLSKIEKYAMTLGATEVVIEGRKGWARVLGAKDYKPRTLRLRKDVRKAWSN